MGKTKDRPRYQGVSLPVPFVQQVKEYIKGKPEYRSIADFVKTVIIEKMTSPELPKKVLEQRYGILRSKDIDKRLILIEKELEELNILIKKLSRNIGEKNTLNKEQLQQLKVIAELNKK